MGAIAESIMTCAQPLLEDTDGSIEEMNKALSISQICWNLALMPEEARNEVLREMRSTLKMEAGEFEAYRREVVDPMIRRHVEMYSAYAWAGIDGCFRGNIRAAIRHAPACLQREVSRDIAQCAVPMQQREEV